MDDVTPGVDASSTQARGSGVETTLLMVETRRIQTYEHNPRHGPNPEYDRIKDSIRCHGLDQPLVITQRPGAADYIVHTGGNTRLLVLRELLEETGDSRFSQTPCVLRPWRCESEVLLAHLRENDLRGSLTYIDKARAVLQARQLLGDELGLETVPLRRLEAELRNAGYRISSPGICLMAHTVETLLPLIPQALEAGMGKHQVQRIRALERAARRLWQSYCAGGDSAFEAVFAALCRRYDGAEWDTGVLQSAIETEIAEDAETSIHTIRVALDAEMTGRERVIPEFVPIKEPPLLDKGSDGDGTLPTPEEPDTPDDDESGLNPTDEVPASPVTQPSQPQDDPAVSPIDVPESAIDTDLPRPTDLKSLRGRAWTLAARLAQRNGIGDLVVPLSGAGLGYVLRDVPDPVLADQLDEETLAQVCMLWWQLAACAEMTFAPLDAIVPLLPADSVLRRALEDQDADLLFNSIWTLDPGHTGYRLWRTLHDRDWQDLVHLMETYRGIRHLAADTGTTIWES